MNPHHAAQVAALQRELISALHLRRFAITRKAQTHRADIEHHIAQLRAELTALEPTADTFPAWDNTEIPAP